MRIEVETFKRGGVEDIARKVCEEATEFYAEHRLYATEPICDDLGMLPLMLEIGDVFTAMSNYCAVMGISAQDCVLLAQVKNLARGYYGTPSEVALEWERDAQEDSSSEQCDDSL